MRYFVQMMGVTGRMDTANLLPVDAERAAEPAYYQLPLADAIAALGGDAKNGLSESEASARLAQQGANTLPAERPTPPWRRFLAQFQDTLVVLLLIATAISFGLWAYERATPLPYDGVAILVIVLINALLGYVQEARAERAVAALREMVAAQAVVVRDGTRRTLPASELVPGDLILFEEGDTIPADGRLLVATTLRISEAALTGESLPVTKKTAPLADTVPIGDRTNMVFSGTAVLSGRGQAIVTATGMQTEMGRIAGLLRATVREATPLQRELDATGRVLGAAVLLLAIAIVATIVLVDGIRNLAGFVEVLLLGIALGVAAVPEGLSAIVTATLALGMRRMARRNAIVRKLPAVETLGAATVIASDKTGTLTTNEMTVRLVATASGDVTFTGTGYAPDGEARVGDGPLGDGPLRAEVTRVLRAASLANNASLQLRGERWISHGDPTEVALLTAAHKVDLEPRALADRFARVDELPFSSERKLMSTVGHDRRRAQHIVFTKGAPDILLARCTDEMVDTTIQPLTEARRAFWHGRNEALAGQGLRALGVASRTLAPATPLDGPSDDLERELVLLGLVGMYDPPRRDPPVADHR